MGYVKYNAGYPKYIGGIMHMGKDINLDNSFSLSFFNLISNVVSLFYCTAQTLYRICLPNTP